jgi:hypothetical protein
MQGLLLVRTPLVCAILSLLATVQAAGAEPPAEPKSAVQKDKEDRTTVPDPFEGLPPRGQSTTKDPPGMKRLLKGYDVWIDPKYKRVVVDGTIVLREGPLEMLACPRGTKEHEAVIAADTKAYAVHAGLLAVGAEAGTPVQFQPDYRPAKGTEIDVELIWTDKDGKTHRAKGQDWVQNAKSGKPLEHPWVFGGSGFWTDEMTGERFYLAESGDFICVSNFPTAMMDLPVPSSQSNDALLYHAFTEKIPPIGTRVRMVLTPKSKTAAGADK